VKAVIMAGGEGTRLRPLTARLPKPMLPVANRPMMEHVVDLLRRHGFDDIVVTLAFLPDAIQSYFGDGAEFGVKMAYVIEERPLGTAGSVANARQHLDERFLVISGDVITDIDLERIVASHVEREATVTIALTPVEDPLEFGIVITREDGSIERFLEKPTWGQVFTDTINTGIYVVEPEVLDAIEPGHQVDFSAEVFPRLLAEGRLLAGAVAEGYWEDVGTLEAYLRVHKDVLDRSVEVRIPGFSLREGVFVGERVDIHPDARIEGPAIIGDHCRIGAGVRLGEYAVLGSNVRVSQDADLERSMVGDHTYLGSAVRLRGTIVGRSCDLRKGVRCEPGAVLGDAVFIGEGAALAPDVKVFPQKSVEAHAIVNDSIVYESRGVRNLFGRVGVAGLANVDLTPELAAKVAMAWASTLDQDATVITSRDTSRAARMLKRAAMAGLNAAGVNVLDLEVASVPLTRFLARTPRSAGGMTIRLVREDPDAVVIRLFDERGIDLDGTTQRKIDRIFQREDFRRAMPGEIGDIGLPSRGIEHYAVALEAVIDLDAVRRHESKIVLDYSYGATTTVMPGVLAKLGANVLAVNPYTSTTGSIDRDEAAQAADVAELVRASGAGLGAVLDPHGEHLTLVDDDGRVLGHEQALGLFVELVARHDGGRLALPVAASSSLQEIAASHGASVLWSKLAAADLQEAATEPGVTLAASLDGGYIVPQFLPAYDAAAALVKLLELVARDGRPVSEVVDGLPPAHVVHETVSTPSELKGVVMRTVMEQAAGHETVLVDGVKVIHEDQSWSLVLPDPEAPTTQVWAEARSGRDARRRLQDQVRRIRQVVR
jgi:mannose-1-phosphate guanylyltransferase/phosphomannomutase